MKPFFKRHLAVLLALFLAAGLPTSAALAKYAQSRTVTDSMTLYVGKKHKLIYETNGGELSPSYPYKGKLLVAGQAYGDLPGASAVTKEHCTFKGWYKSEDPYSEDEVTSASTMEDEDTRLYAHWGGTWNVVIDSNGGTLYVRDKNIVPGASETNPIETDRPAFNVSYYDGAYNLLLITAEKTGYWCTGYFDEPVGGIKVWEANGHCVDGDHYYKNLNSPHGMLWINSTRPQKGDSFVFYPQWEANKYTVEYDPNCTDAEGTMESSEHTYDQAAHLRENGFSREGYTFAGWSTEMELSAGSRIYKDKESVKNLTEIDGDTVTLYAVWKADASADQDTLEPGDLDELEDFDPLEQEDFEEWEADSFLEMDPMDME